MDRASQSPHLNPTQTPRSHITMPEHSSPYAYALTGPPFLSASYNASSSSPPSMTSEETPSASQCISVHTLAQPGFADPQPLTDSNERDGVLYGGDSQYWRLFDLRGKSYLIAPIDSHGLIIILMHVGTSPPCYKNSTFSMEGDGAIFDLQETYLHTCDETAPTDIRSQIQETRPTFGHVQLNEEPWSPLNTRVSNSYSELHQLRFWQNGPVREQMHTQYDGGPLVSHLTGFNGYHSRYFPPSPSATVVASISQYGRVPSDEQNNVVDWRLSDNGPGPRSGMPLTQDDQFDGASTATYGPESPLEQFQDLSRPVSRFDRRSDMESNFGSDAFQYNLVQRSNQMLMTPGQAPTHYNSHPFPLVYGYQPSSELSYRQHLDNCRRSLPYCQARGTDSRAYQTPPSNLVKSLTRPPYNPPRRFPLHSTTEYPMGRSVVGPVRTTALTTRAKGVRQGPLNELDRAHARDTRGEGSCWLCKIQRYRVRFRILLQ